MTCDFDIQFTYILPWWKKVAYNGKVLEDIINEKSFTILKEKYYLEDTDYSNSESLLLPYKKVYYHLKKQAIAACCPRNAKQLFNL